MRPSRSRSAHPETPNASVNADSKVGTGTVNNDDQVTVTINQLNDVEPANGNTKNYDFTVTLSAAADIDVVVPWSVYERDDRDADFGAGLTKTGKVTIPPVRCRPRSPATSPVAGDLLSESGGDVHRHTRCAGDYRRGARAR